MTRPLVRRLPAPSGEPTPIRPPVGVGSPLIVEASPATLPGFPGEASTPLYVGHIQGGGNPLDVAGEPASRRSPDENQGALF